MLPRSCLSESEMRFARTLKGGVCRGGGECLSGQVVAEENR